STPFPYTTLFRSHFRRRRNIEVAHDNFSAAIPGESCGLVSAAGRQACSQGGIAYQARDAVADTGDIRVVEKQPRDVFDNDLWYRIDPSRDARQAAGARFKPHQAKALRPVLVPARGVKEQLGPSAKWRDRFL